MLKKKWTINKFYYRIFEASVYQIETINWENLTDLHEMTSNNYVAYELYIHVCYI